MKGIAVFYKPKNWSSYDVIRFLKKELNEKKIGHGGTLDPLAEGVLIIGIKREGTKRLAQFLKEKDKEYIATIILGGVSETFDVEGEISYLEVKKWPTEEKIKKCLKKFKGKILQVPPPYSAVKISGKSAYKLARIGKKLELKPREVFVSEIQLLDYRLLKEKLLEIKVRLKVKSGFYVRSFANDFGKILNTGGVLKELLRTQVGEFKIKEAITIEDFKRQNLELYFKVCSLVSKTDLKFFVKKLAALLKISGRMNLEDDGIEIIAQGQERNLQEFLDKVLKSSLIEAKDSFYYFRKPQAYYHKFDETLKNC